MVLGTLSIVPPLSCTAQGRVCPASVICQLPVLFVVVGASALPATQMTLTVPDTIGEPTAAAPLKVLVAGALLPPSPSQPNSDNVAMAVSPKPSFVALRKVFLSCKMSSPSRIEPQ